MSNMHTHLRAVVFHRSIYIVKFSIVARIFIYQDHDLQQRAFYLQQAYIIDRLSLVNENSKLPPCLLVDLINSSLFLVHSTNSSHVMSHDSLLYSCYEFLLSTNTVFSHTHFQSFHFAISETQQSLKLFILKYFLGA